MDNAMTGHSNEHAGLQNHSVGEHYPLAVVGIGSYPTLYVIENLMTGEVMCSCPGIPYQHYESKYLYAIIGLPLFDGDCWVKGRPRFNDITKDLEMPTM